MNIENITKANDLAAKIKSSKMAINLIKNHDATITVNVGSEDTYMDASNLLDGGCNQMTAIVLDILEHELEVAEMELDDL